MFGDEMDHEDPEGSHTELPGNGLPENPISYVIPEIELTDGPPQDIDEVPDYSPIASGSATLEVYKIGAFEFNGATQDYPLAKVHGTPEEDAKFWHHQGSDFTCAVVSQEYILESFTGQDLSEEDLTAEAIIKGYCLPGVGSYPEYVGSLLEDYGIKVFRSIGNTIDDLKNNLASGKKVIVSLDANEIWDPTGLHQLMDLFFMPQANHAVMVTGYDDISQEVILNDPGHPDGAGMRIPLSVFENAWEDSGRFMVHTLSSPPSFTA